MADPIEVNYTPDGDDWTVTVKGRGQTLTGRAVGLIAARDRADQLVEKISPEEKGHRTVVHLLNGDAVDFTTAYLTARLAKTEPAPLKVPTPTESTDGAPAQPAAVEDKPAEEKPTPRPSPTPRPTPAPRQDADAAAKAEPPPVPEQPVKAAEGVNSGS